MRRAIMTVFDEYISGTTNVYTPPEHNNTLGQFEKLAIEVVCDRFSSAAGNPTFTLAIEHANDDCNWKAKSGTAEINAQTITVDQTTALVATDGGSTPNLGSVRFRMALAGSTPAAHVRVTVCGRNFCT
jgi:hypothetical protein